MVKFFYCVCCWIWTIKCLLSVILMENTGKHWNKSDALHDFVPFMQFRKLQKHPWMGVTFSKVAGWSLQRKKSNTPEHGQKLCGILKLSTISVFLSFIFFVLRNEITETKSWMNRKFQLSLYLIIPQSPDFQFF